MIDAFDIARVITRTNQLYREMKAGKIQFYQRGRSCGKTFMDRTMANDYRRMISRLWAQLQFSISTDSVSLLQAVPVESD